MEISNGVFRYLSARPDGALADFVDRFWLLENQSAADQELLVLPDGRVDVFFVQRAGVPLSVVLRGLETAPTRTTFAAGQTIFAISFKLSALAQLPGIRVASIVNDATPLPVGFLDFTAPDLLDFKACCTKAAVALTPFFNGLQEEPKQRLFQLLYASAGALRVQALSQQAGWPARQINRYFQQHVGLSLKTYCTILRFRASFQHLKEGKLFPEQPFADQAHFIREVKKLAGVVPKELAKNKNDRFIQFSVLD